MKPDFTRFVALSFSVIALSSPAFAATTWNGSASGSWATVGNWTSILPTSADLVTYGAGAGAGTAVANGTQTLNGSYSVLGFSVGNNSASPIVIDNGTGTNTLTIGTSGILLNSASGGGFTINADVVLGGAQSWTTGDNRTITANNVNLGANILTIAAVGTGSNTTINGLISGTGGITKSSAQNAYITGTDNTFSGAVIVSGGTLNIKKLAAIGSNSSLGTGSGTANIVLNGGTLNYAGTTTDTTNRAIEMRAGAGISNNGTGTISFTAASVSQTLAASARTFTLSGTNTNANTFGSILGDSGTLANISSLAKSGAGTWVMTGVNTYTGSTAIQGGGVLRVTGSGVLGGKTGSTTDANNICFTGTTANSALEFETAANLGAADQVRFRTTDGGPGILRYIGTTSQTVSKALQCDTSRGMRLNSDSVGGAITYNGSFANVTGSRPIYLGGTGTGDNTVQSTITGNGAGTLTKDGVGKWILAGANTYTGATTIDGGTLKITDARALGGSNGTNGPAINLKSGTLDLGFNSSTGAYASNITNLALRNGNITLGGTAGATSFLTATGVVSAKSVGFGVGPGYGTSLGYSATNNGDTATISAYWTSVGSSSVATTTVNVGDSSFTPLELDFTGRINNIGQIDGQSTTLIKTGAGTMRISTENYLPGLRISEGKLIVNHANALGAARTAANLVTVDTTGTLDLNGFSNSIGGLDGSTATTAIVTNNNATGSVLTIGTSNATTSYAGLIQNGTGTVGITKTGTGTLTLSGTNAYTGATTISTGTLSVTGTQTGSAVSIASAATLGGTGTVGATTVASGGLLAPGVAGAGTLTTGNLIFSGTGTITLGDYTGYSAAPAIAAGTLSANGAAGSVTLNLQGATASNGTYQLLSYMGGTIGGIGTSAFVLGTKPATGARQTQNLMDTGSLLNWVVTGANPYWTGLNSTEWSTDTIAGSKNWKLDTDHSATDYLTGDVSLFNDSATNTTLDISVADVAPASMAFSNVTKDYTIQGSLGITSGALIKSGAGGLTINTSNSFSGGSTLGGGTITLGTATALGSGSVALNSGTLAMNGQSIVNALVLGGGSLTGSGTIGGNVTGSSSLSYSSSGGTLILSGTNTVGATIGAGATLQIGMGSTSGTIGNVANEGTLVFDRSDALTYSGTISGTGAVHQIGAGNLTFSTAKTYSGATNVSGSGKLVVSNTLLNSSGFNVGTGATLEVGAINVFVSGHGTALAGTRVLSVNGGTLLMNSNFEARFGNVTLQNGATWTSNRGLTSYDALLADTTTGAATVTVSGAGVSTMNGTGGIHLQGVQNFNVADVTATSDPDLIVSMILAGVGTTGGTVGGINKLGDGTMVLSGSNTYLGATTISAGTVSASNIVVSGSASNLGNAATSVTLGAAATQGTLSYTGNSAIYTRGFTVGGAGGGRLDVTTSGQTLTVSTGNVTGTGLFTVGGAGHATIHSNLTQDGGLTKTDSGTLILSGTNTYTGATTVSNGLLRINGSITGAGAVSVSSGATLGGTGSVAGAVTVDGTLSPGASVESFAIGGDLTFHAGSSLTYEMDSSAISSASGDLLIVSGNLNLTGPVGLTLPDLGDPNVAFAPNTTLSLINYAGAWNSGYFTYSGNELLDNEVFTAGLNTWKISYYASTGGLNFATEATQAHFVNLTAVPEPGSLFAIGCLIGSGALLRSRRRAT
jgi:fibronectin-binding autotransporter adhesin